MVECHRADQAPPSLLSAIEETVSPLVGVAFVQFMGKYTQKRLLGLPVKCHVIICNLVI